MSKTICYDIPPRIISDTKCDKRLSCLSHDKDEICGVERSLGHTMLVLECKELQDCRHNKSYGSLYVCNCPVRMEIYKKYRV